MTEKYKTRHIRLDDEVATALGRAAAVHGSPNKALRAILLLIYPPDGNGDPRPVVDAILDADAEVTTAVLSAPEVTDFEEEPEPAYKGARFVADENHPSEPAMTGLKESEWQPPDTRPKNTQCQHCPKRFASASKFAIMCPECTEAGHRGEPRDCRECGLNQGAL